MARGVTTHDVPTSGPARHHDLLGELASAQWAVEDVVSVVDGGLAIDLTGYLTARARLDAAVTAWNLQVGAARRRADAHQAGRGRPALGGQPPCPEPTLP